MPVSVMVPGSGVKASPVMAPPPEEGTESPTAGALTVDDCSTVPHFFPVC
jgi:hypothetical protein